MRYPGPPAGGTSQKAGTRTRSRLNMRRPPEPVRLPHMMRRLHTNPANPRRPRSIKWPKTTSRPSLPKLNRKQGPACLSLSKTNSRHFWSAASSPMGFCGCGVGNVPRKNWWRSPVNAVGFVLPVAHAAWPRRPPTSWITSSPGCRYANGWYRFLSPYGISLPPSRSCFRRCCRSFTGPFPLL